jgi:hypothetical protein
MRYGEICWSHTCRVCGCTFDVGPSELIFLDAMVGIIPKGKRREKRKVYYQVTSHEIDCSKKIGISIVDLITGKEIGYGLSNW